MINNTLRIISILLGSAFLASCSSGEETDKTRGAGIYPGRMEEYAGPRLVPAGKTFRNLALGRSATQSSACDLDLTAQLVTDGIIDSDSFYSAWKSAGAEKEWISVDLGGPASIDSVSFHWVNPPLACKVETSDNGRFVRACLEGTANGEPFELKEWEIWGRGGVIPVAGEAPGQKGYRQVLTRGGWKLQRASEVPCDGIGLSSEGYDDSAWLPATVPGTVLASYVNAGAVPDPNFSDRQLCISESYFHSDFWYRNTFTAHPGSERQELHFDGINWKADVYLNGQQLGRIDGAFREAGFDVTGILADGSNYLAVKVISNETFGKPSVQDAHSAGPNGGLIGADNPTVHASVGWDWVPTVRGRNAGILGEVSLRFTGPVTLEDPFVRTLLPLPDTTSADILAEVTLVNHSDKPVEGILKGSYGDLHFEKAQQLEAGESALVKLDTLKMDRPHLWWPNGYGEPYLYKVQMSFVTSGKESDRKEFFSGVRQWNAVYDQTAPDKDGCTDRLNLYVNGKRFVAFGGNWGLPEHLLNYRAREYDIAVRYHRNQHFTMIRNWVGQTGDKAFYEACDRYGIVVWQDFWLANPADGPDPADPQRFNATAREYVRRIRNHPSIGIYVGRNEGYPPKEIDDFLAQMVPADHPGIHYISNSADGPVSGRGPYRALPPKEYYSLWGQEKLHSERGYPCVMNIENLTRALGQDQLEPVSSPEHPNAAYGLHDYALGGIPNTHPAQRTYTFAELLDQAFGEPENAAQFTRWAQWIQYDGYRAIFESRSSHRQGMLLWMSHPAWPSLVWQTYDYYFEPTAAWFACRKACEPIHIQWNPLLNQVEVVSWYNHKAQGLTAKAEVLDLQGHATWADSRQLDLAEDETLPCFSPVFSDSPVSFLRLSLTDAQGRTVSENFYWKGREEGNLKALLTVPATKVSLKTKLFEQGSRVELKATVTNKGNAPALMIRAKVNDSATGELILPVSYSDNYFFLMPGESKQLSASVEKEDCHGKPVLSLEGMNL